ncbi:hypothetical protein NBO_421gi001 [Nosema bombycis CQ1]|uniref:Uncharacterized protein n=1 Tax=Nosema bombycis (strain CQ1 / CVCC 102059) TaxID=578461 RepID=R0M3B4_NOSB1|nr:hypothetical protein NBO_421gi001 [Nosema bombycis CQ1]|eukprot:EOB12504.1 hypothetical protein NBO_421gi001 [Nosema bombycis CQ1]
MQENGIITKKEYLNIMKDNKNGKDNNDTPKKLKVNDTPNLSLLNFLTKEKKINNDFDNDKNFKPIIFDSSVYVYKLNNPNFESLRKRKDLVNPKKMMFIKFTEDIKPPIYKPTENKLKHKISYQKIFNNVDYDEESTWEDDPDAESIDSVETEEDDTVPVNSPVGEFAGFCLTILAVNSPKKNIEKLCQ